MRVVEPSDFEVRKRNHGRSLTVLLVLVLLAGAGYLGWKVLYPKSGPSKPSAQDQPASVAPDPAPAPKTYDKPKEFTGDQFKELYRSVYYPNTEPISESLSITGNTEADARVRKLAEARGYRLTRIPVASIQKIDEPLLGNDNLLQPLAAKAWNDLKAAAAKDGLKMTLVSAFRAPEYQRELFMQRLLERGVTVEQVAAGQADGAVEANLQVTAVPGYSRHHTGYTVDLWCEGSGSFAASPCFEWIKGDNYKHAKESGWIPSYPEGTDLQGPEPEPWEYVWVGKDVLYQ